jgi:hypothetical protein
MSFTRNLYDVNNYERDLYQTVRGGHYRTNLPRNACDGCFSPEVRNSSHGNSIYENKLVDVDSELMGLNVKNSKCPTKLYDPIQSNEFFVNSGKTDYEDCNVFSGENTLLSNPPTTLRGTGWNRWEWLCRNPQDKAIIEFNKGLDIGANTNLIAKDNHRPCIPNPVKQSLSHPPKENIMMMNEKIMFNDPLDKYKNYNYGNEMRLMDGQNWRNYKDVNKINNLN